jgi:hypothetical protein
VRGASELKGCAPVSRINLGSLGSHPSGVLLSNGLISVGGCDGGGRGKSVDSVLLFDLSVSLRSESGGVGGKSADTRRRCTRSSSVARTVAIFEDFILQEVLFYSGGLKGTSKGKVRIRPVNMDRGLFWLWCNEKTDLRDPIEAKCPGERLANKNTYNANAKLGQRLHIRHTGMSRYVCGRRSRSRASLNYDSHVTAELEIKGRYGYRCQHLCGMWSG